MVDCPFLFTIVACVLTEPSTIVPLGNSTAVLWWCVDPDPFRS